MILDPEYLITIGTGMITLTYLVGNALAISQTQKDAKRDGRAASIHHARKMLEDTEGLINRVVYYHHRRNLKCIVDENLNLYK